MELELVSELIQLSQLEQQITSGLDGMIGAGMALATIRDQHLYKQSHSSFDAYCQERWQFSRRRADQLIGAAAVVGVLAQTPQAILPNSERQTRPLTTLPTDKARAEVWAEAVEVAGGNQPSNAQVQAATVRHHATKLPRTAVGAVATIVGEDTPIAQGTEVVIESIDRSQNSMFVRAPNGQTSKVFRSEIAPHSLTFQPEENRSTAADKQALKALLKEVLDIEGTGLPLELRDRITAAILR
jgi:hypothetical protein